MSKVDFSSLLVMALILIGQLQRFYKLMSYERAFKNDMCITEISQVDLELWSSKDGSGMLIDVGKFPFRRLELPITAENDIIVEQ